MKFIDDYRDPKLGQRLIDHIQHHSTTPARFMEFCGGHTVAIFRHGIRQLLPKTIELLSGPGCPVCVTANQDLDKAIALAKQPDIIVASFGDMLRVPGSYSSLQQTKAEGGDVRVVYSTQDALSMARDNPDKSLVFIGIGFETTAPTTAASIIQAETEGINNYYVLPLHKLCPPVMKAILDLGEVNLSGIICPGHVSTIIGSHPYNFIPQNHSIACVVAGFEPLDILLSIDMLVNQVEMKQYLVEIAYRRGVKPEGNQPALKLMDDIFETCDANWRGIGVVPASGLKLNHKYQRFDAENNFNIDAGPAKEPPGCICGSILRGTSTPRDCPLFHASCTPENPVGPCMVSSEGACATYYHYGDAYDR
jgi:hydrogenase expression/formation protein HypD